MKLVRIHRWLFWLKVDLRRVWYRLFLRNKPFICPECLDEIEDDFGRDEFVMGHKKDEMLCEECADEQIHEAEEKAHQRRQWARFQEAMK